MAHRAGNINHTSRIGIRSRSLALSLGCPIFAAFASVCAWPAVAADAPSSGAKSDWHPAVCPPPAESSTGPSSLQFEGPCTFEHKGIADCWLANDDFDAELWRATKNDNKLWFKLSVEHQVTPGHYKDNEMLLSVQDQKKIYRWRSEAVELTVGPGLEYIVVHDAHLPPEPVLVDCTGPMSNYQCAGRGDEPEVLKTDQVVSGKLFCKRVEKKED